MVFTDKRNNSWFYLAWFSIYLSVFVLIIKAHNSKLKIHLYEIRSTCISNHVLFGGLDSERYNHPFQNPAHKTFLGDILKIKKIMPLS